MAAPRSWKYSPIVGVTLVVIIIAAVVSIPLLKKAGTTHLGETREIIAFCEETGKVFSLKIETGSKPPYMSSESGEKTAYVALQCQNCNTIYGMKKTPANENECPYCRQRVPTLLPYVPEQQNWE